MEVWRGEADGFPVSIRREVKVVYEPLIELDGTYFSMKTVEEILDGLEDTGGFERLVIYNNRLGEALRRLKVATPSIRGSYERGPAFEEFFQQFQKVYGAIDAQELSVRGEWRVNDAAAVKG